MYTNDFIIKGKKKILSSCSHPLLSPRSSLVSFNVYAASVSLPQPSRSSLVLTASLLQSASAATSFLRSTLQICGGALSISIKSFRDGGGAGGACGGCS